MGVTGRENAVLPLNHFRGPRAARLTAIAQAPFKDVKSAMVTRLGQAKADAEVPGLADDTPVTLCAMDWSGLAATPPIDRMVLAAGGESTWVGWGLTARCRGSHLEPQGAGVRVSVGQGARVVAGSLASGCAAGRVHDVAQVNPVLPLDILMDEVRPHQAERHVEPVLAAQDERPRVEEVAHVAKVLVERGSRAVSW